VTLKIFPEQPIATSLADFRLEVCPMKSFVAKTSAALLVFGAMTFATLTCGAADRRVQRRIQPIYPELAKRMRVGGTVRIEATVAPDGSVIEAKAVSGNRMLAPAAEEAIRKWKFAPETAASTEDVEIDFQVGE
jgi:TonB family protein